MHAGLLRDALTVVLGVVTGMLSAAFGVGGAVISTPGIRALGATATLAVGTTLPSILPSAVTGTARYVREELILWRVVLWTAPAGLVASVGGSLLSKVVPGHGHLLMVLTAVLIGVTAWRMARHPAREGPVDPEAVAVTGEDQRTSARLGTHPLVLIGIGLAAGTLSGLLGIGGGVIMVPALTELAGLPIKRTVATSLVCVGLFAVPGTIAHSLLGDIDWRFAVALSVGVVPGARLGAMAAIRASDRRLRLAVASGLGVIAVIYAATELAALH